MQIYYPSWYLFNSLYWLNIQFHQIADYKLVSTIQQSLLFHFLWYNIFKIVFLIPVVLRPGTFRKYTQIHLRNIQACWIRISEGLACVLCKSSPGGSDLSVELSFSLVEELMVRPGHSRCLVSSSPWISRPFINLSNFMSHDPLVYLWYC